MNLLLENKVVLVSGSTRGIGKAVAREYLDEGARVAITGLHSDSTLQSANDLSQMFGSSRVTSFAGDLTIAEEIKKCTRHVLDEFGQIDILVANVGSGSGNAGVSLNDEEWSGMMNLNFDGARRLTDAILPTMLNKQSGSIVYISSIAGKEVLGAPIHYSVAKASLNAYAKNLSKKLAGTNIRVNTVCPGNIFVEGGTWDTKLKKDTSAVMQMLNDTVSLKRLGRPEEIAHIVVFLSSEKASFLTGSCIVVDGGQTISF